MERAGGNSKRTEEIKERPEEIMERAEERNGA